MSIVDFIFIFGFIMFALVITYLWHSSMQEQENQKNFCVNLFHANGEYNVDKYADCLDYPEYFGYGDK
jgi:hypothetical protein